MQVSRSYVGPLQALPLGGALGEAPSVLVVQALEGFGNAADRGRLGPVHVDHGAEHTQIPFDVTAPQAVPVDVEKLLVVLFPGSICC